MPNRRSKTEFFANKRFLTLSISVFLLVLVVAVFWQTANFDFINYDDAEYLYENPFIARGLSGRGIAWAFTTIRAANWHPLTWLSHLLDYEIYGLFAGGHHVTNVLLHAANAILLFLVLKRMTGDVWPSLLAAALFAVHPLRVESVAWVSERKDVLSGLFFMLTLLAYVEYVKHPFSAARYTIVAATFALGLMAKPALVTLPFLLLLLDYWPLRRTTILAADNSPPSNNADERPGLGRLSPVTWLMSCKNSRELTAPGMLLGRPTTLSIWLSIIVEKLPLLALAAGSCAVTLFAQQKAMTSLQSIPLSTRIANAVVSYAAYLKDFACPTGLSIFYPHPKDGLPIWPMLVSASLLAAITAGVLIYRRRLPYLTVGWFWYLGVLVPMIGLVQVGSQAKADRYTYLSQIGICIALAWSVSQIAASWPRSRWICITACAAAIAVCAGSARHYASFWKNGESLWNHVIECTPDNYLAHNSLGELYARQNMMDEAIAEYDKALAIYPKFAAPHGNLGWILMLRGDYDRAIAECDKALEIQPDMAQAHYNRAWIHALRGQRDKAIAGYRKAISLDPDYLQARNNLGAVLADDGQFLAAIAEYNKAIEIGGENPAIWYNMGNAFAGLKRFDQAAEQYRRVLSVLPDDPDALRKLSEVEQPKTGKKGN